MLFNPNAGIRRDRATDLCWSRCGDDWVLKLDKRKLGHVLSRRQPSEHVALAPGRWSAVRYGESLLGKERSP
jgi:hypothetical protein